MRLGAVLCILFAACGAQFGGAARPAPNQPQSGSVPSSSAGSNDPSAVAVSGSSTRGVLIVAVAPDSPAARAGLLVTGRVRRSQRSFPSRAV